MGGATDWNDEDVQLGQPCVSAAAWRTADNRRSCPPSPRLPRNQPAQRGGRAPMAQSERPRCEVRLRSTTPRSCKRPASTGLASFKRPSRQTSAWSTAGNWLRYCRSSDCHRYRFPCFFPTAGTLRRVWKRCSTGSFKFLGHPCWSESEPRADATSAAPKTASDDCLESV